ncbi:Guanosine-3',5'-bis(diphosphate) 3'-pyrophosphohydrolase / GTP pyrophosphokinase, (p)ppGpp synthetase II [hydrothermal vent metagenome]|uniref:Guanosine-3',5'-bis(Diphosphate) 3'-pyrophosphohydrolase / GTP pyrophosphokinase, (P)ppGpp synthetase II n=1 Tax=hydrothermal vent metagenome TaxID=652676 RepID=A0A3B0RZZ4_9ZZZZ
MTGENASPPTGFAGGIRSSFLEADDLVAAVVKYDPDVDTEQLRLAYSYAKKKHGTQKRHSGEPYYAHPVHVAAILIELHLDSASIITALLHDTVEDTSATLQEVTELFSPQIADLVDGVTKLTQLELKSTRSKQGENLQKFVLAITKDVRVLLVKLADRLHNMRTLHHIARREKRQRISRETLDIYAPLAKRIGVQKICSELEDLAFHYLDPSAYVTITKRLALVRERSLASVRQLSGDLNSLLMENGFEAVVYGREKRPYSIWRKLQHKNITFDEVADVYAFRVLVDKPEQCYAVLGLIHTSWRCVPDRFRDFISVPKPNHYQSLHTTVIAKSNVRVELQIRTRAMHTVAEEGVAAHWRYKQGEYAYDKSTGGDPLELLKPLLEIVEHGGDADDFLEHARLEMFQDQVFTFTPDGKLIALPEGATAVDFAYAVHTDIGDECIGAIINGRERPLRTHLQNGDSVQVIRGGRKEPPAGWENMVVTGRARSAIRRLIRKSEASDFRKLGRRLVERVLASNDLSGKINLSEAAKRLQTKTVGQMYIQLGRGLITGGDFLDALFPGRDRDAVKNVYRRELITDETADFYVGGAGLKRGVSIHFAKCCTPIPGDRILAIPKKGRGFEVHVRDCEKAVTAINDGVEPIQIGWTPQAATEGASVGRIVATVIHRSGSLAEIANAVGHSNGNIMDVKTLSRGGDFFDMSFDVEVLDAKHLWNVVAAIRACACVDTADRVRGIDDEDEGDAP